MEKRAVMPPPPSPLVKTALLKAENPPVHYYRYLYDVVGRPYFWVERRLWSDDQLKAHLSNEKIALYVLYVGGVPAGMAELDFREKSVAQIAYFGLTPDFTGRRIGPWLLHQMIELAWDEADREIPVEHLYARPQERRSPPISERGSCRMRGPSGWSPCRWISPSPEGNGKIC